MSLTNIPVIDLFAGPGGLSEGFSSLANSDGKRIFDVRVSIEKDLKAYETLRLRAFFRAFPTGSVPDCYYDYLRGNIQKEELLSKRAIQDQWRIACHEAHHATLGEHSSEDIDRWIRDAIGGNHIWVLIGGPPCQAYSTAGRARMRNGDPDAFEMDKRHFLYKEYLRIIQKFGPAVFVMENVKGMLSSTHGGARIFDRIREDLSRPQAGLEYELRSFVRKEIPEKPSDFIIEAEKHGVPQTRHRVIIFGIRSDLASRGHCVLEEVADRVEVKHMLSNMPFVRSRLSLKSKVKDSLDNWLGTLKETPKRLSGWNDSRRGKIERLINDAIQFAEVFGPEFVGPAGTGDRFIPEKRRADWKIPKNLFASILDPKLGGICQHETRSHMPTDLHRYMFAACYADEYGVSPKLGQFPTDLLPEHRNVDGSARTAEVPFEDRFRVQCWGGPSTTILSHMAKDGHYFIHPDSSQCRSLTVREAARLQTFPDNYFFEGNKIDQYTQVGNAVPPYLAKQLAEVVAHFLEDSQQADQTFHEASLEHESPGLEMLASP